MASRLKPKLYVIKKYVKATSAAEALRKERNVAADDVWVDDNWRKSQRDNLAEAIGFALTRKQEQSED
jgi:hypothetical protein